MRGAFPGLCLALLAAELGERLCATIHYLVQRQLGWLGLTITGVVPAYMAQLLSILWFRADGHPPGCSLLVFHLLQLGLWKWYWDVLWMVAKTGSSAGAADVLTQHGDMCVLQLLEALLQTLPHLLLQAYTVAVDPADFILDITCLLKPGHLCLLAAAILCLLLWRTGMLGTRILALVLFARLYSFWVFAVAGAHWLLMSFWLVAQPYHWRLCNCLVGAVYIFCYINVRPGPSKHMVAVFYAIMLMENTLLLLLATRFLQAELRNSLCVTGAVMSGSVIGATALLVYYSLFHPKSTEICQGFLEAICSAAAASDEEVAGATPGWAELGNFWRWKVLESDRDQGRSQKWEWLNAPANQRVFGGQLDKASPLAAGKAGLEDRSLQSIQLLEMVAWERFILAHG